MKSRSYEALGALQQEKESQAKEREAYEGRMARLRKEVDESLKKTFKRVYGSFDQATDQVEALRSDILIPRLQLDSFKVV